MNYRTMLIAPLIDLCIALSSVVLCIVVSAGITVFLLDEAQFFSATDDSFSNSKLTITAREDNCNRLSTETQECSYRR